MQVPVQDVTGDSAAYAHSMIGLGSAVLRLRRRTVLWRSEVRVGAHHPVAPPKVPADVVSR